MADESLVEDAVSSLLSSDELDDDDDDDDDEPDVVGAETEAAFLTSC